MPFLQNDLQFTAWIFLLEHKGPSTGPFVVILKLVEFLEHVTRYMSCLVPLKACKSDQSIYITLYTVSKHEQMSMFHGFHKDPLASVTRQAPEPAASENPRVAQRAGTQLVSRLDPVSVSPDSPRSEVSVSARVWGGLGGGFLRVWGFWKITCCFGLRSRCGGLYRADACFLTDEWGWGRLTCKRSIAIFFHVSDRAHQSSFLREGLRDGPEATGRTSENDSSSNPPVCRTTPAPAGS